MRFAVCAAGVLNSGLRADVRWFVFCDLFEAVQTKVYMSKHAMAMEITRATSDAAVCEAEACTVSKQSPATQHRA